MQQRVVAIEHDGADVADESHKPTENTARSGIVGEL
jgi:hypothetical protein